METRPQVSIDNPKMSFGDVATRVGNMWRELVPEQRSKYDSLAQDDKERYDREKQSIQETYASLTHDNMGYMHSMHQLPNNYLYHQAPQMGQYGL